MDLTKWYERYKMEKRYEDVKTRDEKARMRKMRGEIKKRKGRRKRKVCRVV